MVSRIFINDEIYGHMVSVIDESGINKGEMNKRLAISLAKEKGLDLVQVSKNNNGLAICKFADSGKIKFEISKKKNEAKPIETKEMMFHINTGINDIKIKKNKVRAMLEKKCIVKFGILLKGRERAFINTAKELLEKNVVDFGDIAKWDDLKVSDNILFFVLKPTKEASYVERREQLSQ